jgi:hypothetical protein
MFQLFRESWISITNAALEGPRSSCARAFSGFKSYENTKVSSVPICFAILRASATIKTLLFNLLECRNQYGIEV